MRKHKLRCKLEFHHVQAREFPTLAIRVEVKYNSVCGQSENIFVDFLVGAAGR
jgi:hypothetical protein